MKRLLAICGGVHQIPIIKKAKELGYEVVNSNLYPNSPAFDYADFTEVIDVLDYEKNYECAKKYNVDGVITEQSELSVFSAAYVSEKMGLPTVTTDLALLFTNKYKMREFCKKNGYLYPKYYLCSDSSDIKKITKIDSKMILKPVDSFSSRGIFIIENIQQLQQYYPEAARFSRDGRSVILEEYIDGTEFTVDGIVVNGKHYTLAISEKQHYKYNQNIACKLLFMYDNPNFDYNHLREIHDVLIEKTGLKMGLTHSEYKFSNGKYYLIEMAVRGGGNYIASEIVPALTGIDNYKIYIQSAAGKLDDDVVQKIKESLIENSSKVAVMKFLDINTAGKRIVSIQGVEAIKSLAPILKFQLNFKVGERVDQAKDDASRPGFYIAIGDSIEELNEIDNLINKLLIIELEED